MKLEQLHIDELTARSGEGDSQAFEELYNHMYDRVFKYALSRSHSREDALDIVSQVFIDTWVGMKTFKYISDEHFYSYVFLIAKRRLGKYYRSHREHVELDESHMMDMYEMDLDGVSNIAVIQRGIEKLRGAYREILELRYWSELSFKEIGDVLNSNESAVRVKHHRALSKLKKIIPAYE